MLNSSEILEKVSLGEISFIEKSITLQYDNNIKLPIDFYFKKEHYEILEIIDFSIDILFCLFFFFFPFIFYLNFMNVSIYSVNQQRKYLLNIIEGIINL